MRRKMADKKTKLEKNKAVREFKMGFERKTQSEFRKLNQTIFRSSFKNMVEKMKNARKKI